MISDGGMHFMNNLVHNILPKYWVRHKLDTTYNLKLVGRWKGIIER